MKLMLGEKILQEESKLDGLALLQLDYRFIEEKYLLQLSISQPLEESH